MYKFQPTVHLYLMVQGEEGAKVLYLGAASGTAVSHVADIVGLECVCVCVCVRVCASMCACMQVCVITKLLMETLYYLGKQHIWLQH